MTGRGRTFGLSFISLSILFRRYEGLLLLVYIPGHSLTPHLHLFLRKDPRVKAIISFQGGNWMEEILSFSFLFADFGILWLRMVMIWNGIFVLLVVVGSSEEEM